jgi:O-succinylbenzoic acid--CoA ligase
VHVDAWLSRAAARHPARPAVNGLGYAALDAAATAAAGRLAAAGVRPGDRVALLLGAGEALAIALHGCLRLGAIAVPVDGRLSEAERRAQTDGCAAVVDAPLELAEALAPAPGRGVHDLDAPAIVVHTSGTTGVAKPVELTYGNWLWSALGSGVALGVDPTERWLCALPLSHVGGLSILLRSAIYGTTAVVHDRFDVQRVVVELMAPEGPTLVSLVPTTLARTLDAGLDHPPRLRCALVGGGPVPPALMERARAAGVPVAQTYGLTEACSQVTTAAPGERPPDAGPPLFCTRVRIAGDDGEILVRGPTVAPGAAGPDGWLATGDLGRLDPEGRLTVTGRLADTIVTGGENVAPAEVEAVLAEHPAVAEAAVHARPDAEWGEAVVATVVLRPGAHVEEEELRRHCAACLARYKVPKQVAFAAALPRSPAGKLQRDLLRDPAIAQNPVRRP